MQWSSFKRPVCKDNFQWKLQVLKKNKNIALERIVAYFEHMRRMIEWFSNKTFA